MSLPPATDQPVQEIQFDPESFRDDPTAGSSWFPLKPGTQWVREGTTDEGSGETPHRVVSTVTDVVREIEGVKAIAVLDEENDSGQPGQVTQVSVDYFAVDNCNAVTKFGAYQEEYEAGEYTTSTDAWLGTAGGGVPGVLMPGRPAAVTHSWPTGQPIDEAAGKAKVVEIREEVCVPLDCYDNVLVVREDTIENTDIEFKFYAAEVGQIMSSPDRKHRHQETEELVDMTKLAVEDLAAASNRVLELEAHAKETVPDIFGSAPSGQRVG